jgi:DNA-binding transcriptional MerR regulator/methylmalonyl-CoA mutase cobalamin-binding subunit
MTHFEPNRPLHPISVVAERTGLSPDLLRVWERRYGVVEPARDEGGRRLYSDSDIERLRLLSQATSAGRSIGQLLELDTAELSELVRSDDAARWKPARPLSEEAEEGFVERAFARTRALDPMGLEAELARAAAVVGAARFMDSVVAPLFRRIGDAWHADELSIAQEHMATGVAHPILARVRGSLPVSPDAPVVVIATPAGERHEIGALLAAGAAALEGWHVTYLGADLPAAEIATAAREAGARMVALSMVYADRSVVAAELRALRDALPPDVGLVVGGAGVTRLNGRGEIAGVTRLANLGELRSRLAEL